jgi:hypothetical protein
MNNNDAGNLPPINVGGADRKKKTTRKTESILSRMPKMRTTTGTSKLGLMDRIKHLSKRDLSYMVTAAGLVFSLPVATNYMTKPDESRAMKPGFGVPQQVNSDSGVFDPGGSAAGGPLGSNGDIITPITGRDPSSLIVNPGDNQAAAQAPTPAPVANTSDTRDGMRNAAMEGAQKAVDAAMAPTNIPKITASIRGYSAVGGEHVSSAGTLSGNNIVATATKGSSKPADTTSLGAKAMSGYAGASNNGPSKGTNTGALEDSKAKGDLMAGHLNGANAAQSLDQAAQAASGIGTGSGVGTGPGGATSNGAGGQNPTDNAIKNSASGGGGQETLAQKLAETAAMTRLNNELAMETFWQNTVPQAIVNAALTPIEKFIGDTIGGVLEPSPAPKTTCYKCTWPASGGGSGTSQCTTDGGVISQWKGSTGSSSGGSLQPGCPQLSLCPLPNPDCGSSGGGSTGGGGSSSGGSTAASVTAGAGGGYSNDVTNTDVTAANYNSNVYPQMDSHVQACQTAASAGTGANDSNCKLACSDMTTAISQIGDAASKYQKLMDEYVQTEIGGMVKGMSATDISGKIASSTPPSPAGPTGAALDCAKADASSPLCANYNKVAAEMASLKTSNDNLQKILQAEQSIGTQQSAAMQNAFDKEVSALNDQLSTIKSDVSSACSFGDKDSGKKLADAEKNLGKPDSTSKSYDTKTAYGKLAAMRGNDDSIVAAEQKTWSPRMDVSSGKVPSYKFGSNTASVTWIFSFGKDLSTDASLIRYTDKGDQDLLATYTSQSGK